VPDAGRTVAVVSVVVTDQSSRRTASTSRRTSLALAYLFSGSFSRERATMALTGSGTSTDSGQPRGGCVTMLASFSVTVLPANG
jgi:hypothetical protein